MNRAIDYAVGFIDWLVLVLLYVRDGLRPKPVVFVHQGGEAIFPQMEVLKVQPVLMAILGDRKAIFLQKVHEWTLHNIRKSTHTHNGATWTYNSYPDWKKKHFPSWSVSWFKANIPQLEDDGFLISTQNASFCNKGEKAYRINYEKLLSLAGAQQSDEGVTESSTPPAGKSPEGVEKKAYNNSSNTSLLKQSVKQETTTTPVRAEESDFLKSLGGAFAVAVDSPDSDSGEFFTEELEAVTDTQADLESPPSVARRHGDLSPPATHGETSKIVVETPPGSASPPSPEAQAWQMACEQLEQEWDEANFETWLRPAELLGVENGVYIIGAPNAYICDMLQYRMNGDVERALSVAMDVEDIKTEYRVHRAKRDPIEMMAGDEVREDNKTDAQLHVPTNAEYFIQRLMDDFGSLTRVTAEWLVTEYGQGRVDAVAHYVKTGKNLNNPAGALIAELRDDKLGLGETRHPNKWDQIIRQ